MTLILLLLATLPSPGHDDPAYNQAARVIAYQSIVQHIPVWAPFLAGALHGRPVYRSAIGPTVGVFTGVIWPCTDDANETCYAGQVDYFGVFSWTTGP